MPSQQNSKYSIGTIDQTYDFDLPSGNTCLLRRIDPIQLLDSNLLDRFDALTAAVSEANGGTKVAAVKAAAAARKGKRAAEEAESAQMLQALLKDKDSLLSAVDMMDRIVEKAVVEPAVARPVIVDEYGNEIPLPATGRRPGIVYTDTISLQDKTAIMLEVFSAVDAAKSVGK